MFHRQLSTAQVTVTAAEVKQNQHCPLIKEEAQNSDYLKALLVELQRRRDDHSYLLHSFQYMHRFDVNRALHDYLLPIYTVCENVLHHSALLQQVG